MSSQLTWEVPAAVLHLLLVSQDLPVLHLGFPEINTQPILHTIPWNQITCYTKLCHHINIMTSFFYWEALPQTIVHTNIDGQLKFISFFKCICWRFISDDITKLMSWPAHAKDTFVLNDSIFNDVTASVHWEDSYIVWRWKLCKWVVPSTAPQACWSAGLISAWLASGPGRRAPSPARTGTAGLVSVAATGWDPCNTVNISSLSLFTLTAIFKIIIKHTKSKQ